MCLSLQHTVLDVRHVKCQDDQSVRHVKFGQHKDAIKTSWSGGWTFVKVPLCCATLFQKFLDTSLG